MDSMHGAIKHEDFQHELLVSASILRDIIERFLYCGQKVTRERKACAHCHRPIPAKRNAWTTKTFDGKGRIITCSKDCLKGAEYAEMQKFGCGNLEDTPMYRGKLLKNAALRAAYRERLDANRQNALDKTAWAKKSFQLDRPLKRR